MSRAPTALFLLADALAGCRPAQADHPAARAVRAYADALADAYGTGDSSDLAGVARPDEVQRVRALIDLKRAAGVVLEAELLAFRVVGVEERAPELVIVRTEERWRYRDRGAAPGSEPGPLVVADMVMELEVARAAGAYRVARARTIATTTVAPPSDAPAAPLPGPAASGGARR
ncbi:MAG: hypothetical protein HY903_00890 [Deltaproteobacteria bacterium]|nr:hypothetical protein [Deltaproteobacteria bacterium]